MLWLGSSKWDDFFSNVLVRWNSELREIKTSIAQIFRDPAIETISPQNTLLFFNSEHTQM
jgi:hypothetical protein